jgi:GNAT superfamily N-acetyltransferase
MARKNKAMEIRRAMTDDEVEALLSVHNAVHPHDRLGLTVMRSWESQVRELAMFVAWEGSRPVGAGSVALVAQRPDPHAEGWVLKEERRRGIGSALYETVSAQVAGWRKDQFEVPVEDADPDGEAFVTKRGFTEIGREIRVSLDLREIEAPEVNAPRGVTIVTWAERPESIRGIYDVAVEALPDIPGQEEEAIEPFEDWVAHEMQAGPADRPEATFVAVAGDEVVGYSKFSLSDAQPSVAHHDITGVKRAWRGRGVARALKQAQIAWAKDNGYEELRTQNEERNAPIRKLNAEFGYVPSGIRMFFRGPISGSGS